MFLFLNWNEFANESKTIEMTSATLLQFHSSFSAEIYDHEAAALINNVHVHGSRYQTESINFHNSDVQIFFVATSIWQKTNFLF